MGTKTDTWDIDDFSGGLDLRHGAFSEDQTVYRVRKNVYTGKGKCMVRRPPCLDVGGTLGSETQGLIYHNGQFYSFKKRGVTGTGSGAANGAVTVLEFDPPEYTTDFHVKEMGVHEGVQWAYILHQGDAGAQLFLHTWDGLISTPTYVMDPSVPGSYSSGPDELVGQVYDPVFVPVAATAVSKLWLSNVGGNVQCCRTADTRIWNQRDSASLLADGEHYVFRVPGGIDIIREFTVPSPFADIKIEGRWTYYVLEKAVGESWETLVELNIAPGVDQWQAFSSTPSWAETPMIGIRIKWNSTESGLIRFRPVAGATSVVIVGDVPVVTATGNTIISMTRVKYSYRGGDETSVSFSGAWSAYHVYLLCIGPDGATLWNVTTDGWPNGYALERRLIIMKLDYTTALTQIGPNFTAFAGTVTTTVASPTVTGVGTAFLTDYKPGDLFVGPLLNRIPVLTISSDTVMTLTQGVTVALTASVYGTADMGFYLYAYQNELTSAWFTAIQLLYFDQAGAEDALFIGTRNHDPTGGLVSAIGTQLNRLMVFYPDSIQSWSIDQATNATAHLANLHFGTGNQSSPMPVPFYESVAVSLESTVRAINVSGVNNDTLSDNNIGEAIEGFPMIQTVASCHWTKLGQLIVAGLDANNQTVFMVYDYSRESKISSWNEWRLVENVPVDRGALIPVGDRLYFRSGNTLRYFDASAVVFRDSGEVAGNAYLSEALTHLNRLNRPNKDKQLQFYDITAEGETFMQYEMSPNGTYGYESYGPSFDNLSFAGCSYGYARLPLRGTAPAFAIHFSSRSESGWKLRQFSLTYQYKDR